MFVCLNCVLWLFQVCQRYKNESYSQHYGLTGQFDDRCFRYAKDTKMKAIHNDRAIDIYGSWVVSGMPKIQK